MVAWVQFLAEDSKEAQPLSLGVSLGTVHATGTCNFKLCIFSFGKSQSSIRIMRAFS